MRRCRVAAAGGRGLLLLEAAAAGRSEPQAWEARRGVAGALPAERGRGGRGNRGLRRRGRRGVAVRLG